MEQFVATAGGVLIALVTAFGGKLGWEKWQRSNGHRPPGMDVRPDAEWLIEIRQHHKKELELLAAIKQNGSALLVKLDTVAGRVEDIWDRGKP